MMDDNAVHPTCDNAAALVPSYLDGELSEAQAAPLRTHLLQCPACREVAKDLKGLKRWFVEEPPPAVPAGFAARVARRAFAGDPGLAAVPAAAPSEGAIFSFVLRLTAAAAALLLFLAAGIQLQSRPAAGGELQAEDLNLVWEEIYGLDAAHPAANPRAAQAERAEKAPPAGAERR